MVECCFGQRVRDSVDDGQGGGGGYGYVIVRCSDDGTVDGVQVLEVPNVSRASSGE